MTKFRLRLLGTSRPTTSVAISHARSAPASSTTGNRGALRKLYYHAVMCSSCTVCTATTVCQEKAQFEPSLDAQGSFQQMVVVVIIVVIVVNI